MQCNHFTEIICFFSTENWKLKILFARYLFNLFHIAVMPYLSFE